MSLYQYCKDREIPNEYTKHCIQSEQVYFNNWKNLNDPMEGFYDFKPLEHDVNIKDILAGEKQTYKVFCSSKGYSNILMWSHYGDGHKGICLEIEIDKNKCKEHNIFYRNVKYKKDLVQIVSDVGLQDQALYILRHKLSKWRYEEEKRFFIKKDVPNSYKIGNIKSIILGSRCKKADEEMISEWIPNSSIEFKKAIFNRNTNQMELK